MLIGARSNGRPIRAAAATSGNMSNSQRNGKGDSNNGAKAQNRITDEANAGEIAQLETNNKQHGAIIAMHQRG